MTTEILTPESLSDWAAGRGLALVGWADVAMFVSVRTRKHVLPSTLRAYSKRGFMPAPDALCADGSGKVRPVYLAAGLDGWLRSRPGRGARRAS